MNTTTKVIKPNWFSNLWHGEARLVKAFYEAHLFWLLLLGLIYLFLLPEVIKRLPMTVEHGIQYVAIPTVIILNIYNLFTLFAIWRCAFNVNKKMWGYLARTYVVLILITLAVKIVRNIIV